MCSISSVPLLLMQFSVMSFAWDSQSVLPWWHAWKKHSSQQLVIASLQPDLKFLSSFVVFFFFLQDSTEMSRGHPSGPALVIPFQKIPVHIKHPASVRWRRQRESGWVNLSWVWHKNLECFHFFFCGYKLVIQMSDFCCQLELTVIRMKPCQTWVQLYEVLFQCCHIKSTEIKKC